MRYVEAAQLKPPVGSGMPEAARNTLVAERLKQSGMAWSGRGATAILFSRSLLQSGRHDAGGSTLVANLNVEVTVQKQSRPERPTAPPHSDGSIRQCG